MSELPQQPAERVTRPTERLKDTEQAPFNHKLFSWKQEDYEKRLKEMAELPCLRDPELIGKMNRVRRELDTYYEQHNPKLWQNTNKTFSPRQVMTRYDGKGWDYSFHEQRREDYPEKANPFEQRRNANELESNIVGIAKKMVRVTTLMVREAREDIRLSSPAEQKRIGAELVQKVEDVFASVFPEGTSNGGVIVEELDGPRGPVYQTTTDGNHRVAAARLIDLKRIRGEVRAIENQEIAHAYWFDMLTRLSEDECLEVQRVYDELYPQPTEEERIAERLMFRRAVERRTEIDAEVARLRAEEDLEWSAKQAKYDLEQERVQSRIALERPLHESLKNDPVYRKILAETGFEYLMNHPNDLVRRMGAVRVDDRGWLLDKDDRTIGTVLGIDLFDSRDGYPKRADGEIISLALKKYRQMGEKEG